MKKVYFKHIYGYSFANLSCFRLLLVSFDVNTVVVYALDVISLSSFLK